MLWSSLLILGIAAADGAPAAGEPSDLQVLASGRLKDATARCTDGERRARLEKVNAEVNRGASLRRAVAVVYGSRWAQHEARDEIVALLVGGDDEFRRGLSAVSHAEPVPEPADVVETYRAALRSALPAGARDEGSRGWKFALTLQPVRRDDWQFDGPVHFRNLFKFAYLASLTDRDGKEIASARGTQTVYSISADNSRKRFITTTASAIVAAIVDELLAKAESPPAPNQAAKEL